MKRLRQQLVFLFGLVFGISGYLIKVPKSYTQETTLDNVPVNQIQLQKLILPLFDDICEESVDTYVLKSAQDFTTDIAKENFMKPEVITNLENLKNGKGLLSKEEIFIEYDVDHMNELKIVYELLFYANNFDTFYKVASWSRQNLNCGIYIDAIYLAILNRRDTQTLSIPGPYELLPNYFIRKDVIIKASSLLAGERIMSSDDMYDDGNVYMLRANYTASIYDNEEESKLAYFHEDIGFNTYYYFSKLKKVPWFNNNSSHDLINYGENLYHIMKQLTARYELERYSNGFPPLESVTNWEDLIKTTTYNPMLIYSNGNEFTERTSSVNVTNDENIAILQNIENNIAMVVQHMRQSGYNKTQILNHLMEVLVTKDNSYETLARQLLGVDTTDKRKPSVLSHYMTSLRDPVFWKLNKKIVNIIDNALQILPSYARNNLYLPGVQIMNVEVKKLITMFDFFEIDVSNALKLANNKTNFQVLISQPRLNHKEFTIKLNVSSLAPQKGYVKIFLGPKLLPGEIILKNNIFMLLDSFEMNLKMGTNIISRKSSQMKLSQDFMSLREIRMKTEDAEYGLNALPFDTVESLLNFPSRLILPKGSSEGLALQIFVFIAPFLKPIIDELQSSTTTEFNSAILSPGFPFDLNIGDVQLFDLPNTFLKDITIIHKENKVSNDKELTETKQFYDSSSQFDYSNKKWEPFDYNSKKTQYGNKNFPIKNKYPENQEDNESIKKAIKITNDLEEKEELNMNLNKDSDINLLDIGHDLSKETKISGNDTLQNNTKRPTLKLVLPTKLIPTIIDYLIHIADDDENDSNDNVYE